MDQPAWSPDPMFYSSDLWERTWLSQVSQFVQWIFHPYFITDSLCPYQTRMLQTGLSAFCDKIHAKKRKKKNLRKEGFVFAYSLKTQSIVATRIWGSWSHCTVRKWRADYSAIRKQRAGHTAQSESRGLVTLQPESRDAWVLGLGLLALFYYQSVGW